MTDVAGLESSQSVTQIEATMSGKHTVPVVGKTSRAAVSSKFVFNAGRVTSMSRVFRAAASDAMGVVPSNPAIDN